MADDNVEHYDAEAVYDEQISPLMTQIIAICKEHKIPMIASFAYQHNEESGIGHCATCLNNFDGRLIDSYDRAVREIRASNAVIATMITRSSNP